MNRLNSTLSIAAVLAASAFALQAPVAGAAGYTTSSGDSASSTQSVDSQQGVPGVEMNVGSSASDRGVPGVEANVGREGDQNNVDTRTLGAGADTGMDADRSSLSVRADRG